MLVHRYAVLKVQPRSLTKRAAESEVTTHGTQLLGVRRAQRSLAAEQRTSRIQNYRASIRPRPMALVVSANSQVELNDGTSAPTGNLRLTH